MNPRIDEQAAGAFRRSAPRSVSGVCLFACLVLSPAAQGHGVTYRVERAETVVVHFSTGHARAMVNAPFRVFAPGDGTVFARGRTDALGRAVFVPDTPGAWRLVMATRDGHGAEVEIPVDRAARPAAGEPIQSGPAGRLGTTLAGIGYLLGLSGLLALWRKRCISPTD